MSNDRFYSLQTKPAFEVFSDFLPDGNSVEDFGGRPVRLYAARVRMIDAGTTLVGGIEGRVECRLKIPDMTLQDPILIAVGTACKSDTTKGNLVEAHWEGCLDLPPGSSVYINPLVQVAYQEAYMWILFDFL